MQRYQSFKVVVINYKQPLEGNIKKINKKYNKMTPVTQYSGYMASNVCI